MFYKVVKSKVHDKENDCLPERMDYEPTLQVICFYNLTLLWF